MERPSPFLTKEGQQSKVLIEYLTHDILTRLFFISRMGNNVGTCFYLKMKHSYYESYTKTLRFENKSNDSKLHQKY